MQALARLHAAVDLTFYLFVRLSGM